MSSEWKKDKYLLLLLCVGLMFVYLKTNDSTIATLLVTCVGGFLSMVRAASSTTQASASPEGDVSVRQESK